MKVEESAMLHAFVLGNLMEHPELWSECLKQRTTQEPKKNHAKLCPWHLQFRLCSGRVLCSAATL